MDAERKEHLSVLPSRRLPCRTRRSVTVVAVALLLAAGACGGGKDHPAAKPAGVKGKIDRSVDAAVAAPGSGGTDGLPADAGPGGTTTVPAGGSTAGPAPSGGAPSAPPGPVATSELDGFLDALAAPDYQRAAEATIGPAQYFVFIRSLLAADADSKQTRTVYRYVGRSFTLAGSSGNRTHFSGRAVLHGTATFADGHRLETSEELADVVVQTTASGPRVVDFQYQGRPLALAPGGATQTLRSGTKVRMVGALSQGDATIVTVQFLGSGAASLNMEAPRLVYPDGEAVPAARALVGSYVYVAFARRDGPTAFSARVTINGGEPEAVRLGF
ncbi:MAG: hypothetical protein QOJ09_1403 [Actinomycetota bacterium]|nr:hypothetical protein [Actinomycetota bacterium]